MVQIVQLSQHQKQRGLEPWLELALDDGASMLRNRIRELRQNRKWSIEKLAERCGVSHPTISRLERSEIKLNEHYLDLVAKALEVNAIELLTDIPIPHTEQQKELVRLLLELPDGAADALIASARAMAKRDNNAA